MKKILLIKIFVFITFLSCQNQTKLERYKDDANGELESIKADMGMENCKFVGLKILKNEGKDVNDSNVITFGWYNIHKTDTFWMYARVFKNSSQKPIVCFSSNFDTLRLNWKNWENIKK